jgi:hypothetical protein
MLDCSSEDAAAELVSTLLNARQRLHSAVEVRPLLSPLLM